MTRNEHFQSLREFRPKEENSEFQKLQKEAMRLWRLHATTYRNLIPEYERLLAKKKRILKEERGWKDKPLGAIRRQSVFKELAIIPFFNIETEEEALAYIQGFSCGKLYILLKDIENALNSHSYNTIRNWNIGTNYFIRSIEEYDGRKSKLGFDPNYPTQSVSGPKRHGKRSSGLSK